MPDVQPQTAHRATPTGRRSREDVIDAALTLLQERGLPDLTMRRLAQALGVQPSALYWHVADKQTLLAAVSGRVLAPALLPTTGTATPSHTPAPTGAGTSSSTVADTDEVGRAPTWEASVRAAAADLRGALLDVRDGAELVSSSLALGLVDLPLAERIAPALDAAGAGPRTVATVSGTLGHFILGHTFHEQQRLAASEAGVLADPGTPAGTAPPAEAPQETFADGVDLVVAGAAVLLAMDRERG